MSTTIPEYRRVLTQDSQVEYMQDTLEKTLREFTRRPENDSQVVENIELTAGYINDVLHRLNRTPRGFHVTRTNVPVIIYENTATTSKTQLSLIPSDTVTCSLVVY